MGPNRRRHDDDEFAGAGRDGLSEASIRNRDLPRVRQPRADGCYQVVKSLENLGTLHAFGADLLDHAEIHAFLRGEDGAEHGHAKRSD